MRNETAEVSTSDPKGGSQLTCQVCGVKFYRKGHLTVHMRIHAANKRYPCEYCDAKFTQKGSYLAHLEIHTEPQAYICPVCDKRYTHRSSMDSHLRTHTQNDSSNPNFVCPVCGTQFSFKDELDDHMKMHPERRAIAASTSSGAARTLALDCVPQDIFMDERIMACDVCGSRFTNERALLAHKRFHKKRPSPSKIQIGPRRKKRRRRLTFDNTMDDDDDELEDDSDDQDV